MRSKNNASVSAGTNGSVGLLENFMSAPSGARSEEIPRSSRKESLESASKRWHSHLIKVGKKVI